MFLSFSVAFWLIATFCTLSRLFFFFLFFLWNFPFLSFYPKSLYPCIICTITCWLELLKALVHSGLPFFLIFVKDDDDDVELNVGLTYWGQTVTSACAQFSVGLTSTETIRLIRTGSSGRPPWLWHSSWTLICQSIFRTATTSFPKSCHWIENKVFSVTITRFVLSLKITLHRQGPHVSKVLKVVFDNNYHYLCILWPVSGIFYFTELNLLPW